MEVYSRDTVNLSVNLLMYYRIYNVRKAIYGVDDLYASVYNVAQAEIKTIMGSMTMTEVLTAQDGVNIMAREKFNNDFEPWGVVCTRLEILDITPPANISEISRCRCLQSALAERSSSRRKEESPSSSWSPTESRSSNFRPVSLSRRPRGNDPRERRRASRAGKG